jgi:uncharacterized membrane protein
MNKKIAICTFLCLLIFYQFSCKHEIPVLPVINPGDSTGTTGVCFESEILPLFQSTCAKSGCHDPISRKEGYQLNTYASIISRGISVGNAGRSKIYEVIIDNNPNDIMPPPPNPALTAAQKSMVAAWINEGARNTINCNSACDTNLFTFSGAILPILQSSCLGCHSASNAVANGRSVILDNYSSVKTRALNGSLYASVAHTGRFPMPLNASKLNDCKITKIRKWIAAGAADN